MLDWNDEEISSLIWGEITGADDHIVPDPVKSVEKGLLVDYDNYGENSSNTNEFFHQRTAISHCPSTTVENNSPSGKTEEHSVGRCGKCLSHDFHSSKLSCSKEDTDKSCLNSSLDLSFDLNDKTSLIVKTKQETIFSEIGIHGNKKPSFSPKPSLSSADVASLLENDLENVEDEEGVDLDYGWAEIGNFEDLDKIFRNDDSVTGSDVTGNADEVWSSPIDAVNNELNSLPVHISSPHLEKLTIKALSDSYLIKKEYVPSELQEPQSYNKRMHDGGSIGFEKEKDITEKGHLFNKEKIAGKGSKSSIDMKVNRPDKNLSRSRKSEEDIEELPSQNTSASFISARNENQAFINPKIPISSVPTVQLFPSLGCDSYRHVGQPQCVEYSPTYSPNIHMAYGYPANQYPSLSTSSQTSMEMKSSKISVAGNNTSGSLNPMIPSKKLSNFHSCSMTMTPQEKIEKLRRRQKMQAMRAIQDHHRQFSHLIFSHDNFISNYPQEKQDEDSVEDGPYESKVGHPLVEVNLHPQKNRTGVKSTLFDECSTEEKLLVQLQDVIRKLDDKTRIHIRDSFMRLAKSAIRRHSISDTSSTNQSDRDESLDFVDEEIDSENRGKKLLDGETCTNRIDRSVAHLLFHKPLEVSCFSAH